MIDMNPTQKIVINIDEQFPQLSQAPVIEAVMDIRAHASQPFEETAVRQALEPRLTGFRFLDSHREFQHEVRIAAGNNPEQCVRDLGWKGLRFQSEDQKKIVQFNRDGFVASRLEPYPNWTTFAEEGFDLWRIFCDIARPVEINRLGLRYINCIELPLDDPKLSEYVKDPPQPPEGLNLPYIGFMHHETFAVPGHAYAINFIRTIQPADPDTGRGPGLILDIDVFTTTGVALPTDELARCFAEMRWLKNKIFFGTITEKTVETLR